MPRKTLGISLIEVLVAVALSSILLTLLSKVLLPGIQIWKQTQAVAALEQNRMLAEMRISSAFRATSPDSVSSIDSPTLQALSFLSHEGDRTQIGFDPIEGKAFWRSMTIFKLNPSEKILTGIRWTQPPLPTTATFAFNPTELSAACSAGMKERKVADFVTSLQVTQIPDSPSFELQIEMEGDTPRGVHTIVHEFRLTPRIQGAEE